MQRPLMYSNQKHFTASNSRLHSSLPQVLPAHTLSRLTQLNPALVRSGVLRGPEFNTPSWSVADQMEAGLPGSIYRAASRVSQRDRQMNGKGWLHLENQTDPKLPVCTRFIGTT